MEFLIAFLSLSLLVGAHILSGAVVEPRAINELFPDWKELGVSRHFLGCTSTCRRRNCRWPFPIDESSPGFARAFLGSAEHSGDH